MNGEWEIKTDMFDYEENVYSCGEEQGNRSGEGILLRYAY